MKIGIFGGTFNPIHNAHLRLARLVKQQLGLQRIVLIPTSQPPHKRATELAPAQARLAMCRLAVEGEDGMEVSDIEVRRKGLSYTADTLIQLEKEYPKAQLHLLMGSDMFLTVHQWQRPEEIFSRAVLCAVAREPAEYEELVRHQQLLQTKGVRCEVLAIPPMPMSSTQIRQSLALGQPITQLVPAKVAEFIQQQGLYRGQNNG